MATTTTRAISALAGAVIVVVGLLTGCAVPTTDVVTTGRVDVTEVVVAAPALVAPQFVADADRPGATRWDDAPQPGSRSAAWTAAAVRVVVVEVELGQQVAAGQVLARLDAGALTAQVTVAHTGKLAAAAQITLLTATIGDLESQRTTVVDARRRVDTAIATLAGNRRTAAGQLAAARRQLATLPPTAPPPQQAQLQQARARLQAAITQLETAIGRLDAGLAQARSQRSRLTTASGRLSDAIKQVTDLRELARIADAAADISLQLARAHERDATITAPAAGTITRVPRPGEVVAPGAGLVTIAQPARTAATWLAPDVAARLCLDDRAEVTADWLPGTTPARVSLIAPTAKYPPTHQATDQMHLTRAIRVEVTLTGPDPNSGLVPGAPLDIRVTPCRTK